MRNFFTSESVAAGHPDKVCDRVADAVLDEYLKKDPGARVACEVCACKDYLLIMGEITSFAKVDAEECARRVIADIGYTDPELGFSSDGVKIDVKLTRQSPDIAMGVDKAAESGSGDPFDLTGAGDQGLMFGYACSETPELMPLPIMLSHAMCARLDEVRKSGELPYLRPDGKGQVTVEYEDGKPVRIEAVVLSAQHEPGVDMNVLRKDLKEHVIDKVMPAGFIDENTKFYINPTGRFETGGPAGDSGLTGRKIIVDTYGGRCPHGGGSFSGKDATKVDRSATYMARYVAKNVVAAGLAKECEIQIAYAIGVAHPVSVFVNTFGTGRTGDGRLAEIIRREFDLRPAAIIAALGLKEPIYAPTAAYGHFGRGEFPWEKTDRAAALAKYI